MTRCTRCGGRTDDFFPPGDPNNCHCGKAPFADDVKRPADPKVPWVLTESDRRFLRGLRVKEE